MFIHDIGFNIFSDPPRVKLNLGSGIDRNQISEGQDVYMDCEIRANPRFYKVEWIHNVSSISNIHEIENMSILIGGLLPLYFSTINYTFQEVQNIVFYGCKIYLRVLQYHETTALLRKKLCFCPVQYLVQ